MLASSPVPTAVAWFALALAATPQQSEAEPPADLGAQVLRYEGLQTLVDHDSFIQFFQSPRFRREGIELRASWAVVWLDREKAGRLSGVGDELPTGVDILPPQPAPEIDSIDSEPEPSDADEGGPLPNIFQAVASSRLGGLAHEMYLEGPVELFVDGERLLLADAFYLDLIDGHGWLANVTATAKRRIGSRIQKLLVRADWMRYSSDSSFRANSALVTTGDFEDSSLSISTGDLRIRPTRAEELGRWEFRLRDNRVHLVGGIWIPLPPLIFNTEASGKPILETFGFGSSARLGSFIQATFNREMGSAGETLNELLEGDPGNYSAHYSLRGSYLGSRGVLADAGIDIESDDHYWLRFQFAFVHDDDEDRGLVRVDPAQRASWRRWARASGRYVVSDREWIQLRFSQQSDPGVQSEFFESDFVRYEQRHSDVVWRRASAQQYISASARVRTDDFQSDVEELPEVRLHSGATEIGSIYGTPLLYRADATAGFLRRREGDPAFALPFDDGASDADLSRVGAVQRISAPFNLNIAGAKLVPFVEGLAAGWSRNVFDERETGRAALVAGTVLSTHLWRALPSGASLQLAPFVGWRTDVASTESDFDPISIDELEDPVDGDVASLGAHAVWSSRTGEHWLDAQVRANRVTGRMGEVDGWAPTEVLAGFTTRLGSVPIGVFHDGFYSAEGLGTVYSLTDLGFRLTPDLSFELGHRRARDADSGVPVFEAASIAGRYRWTEKWEFEGRHQLSIFESTPLEDEIILRRFGYDLVLDISFSRRAGEGSSIGFRVEPTIVYDQRELGRVRALYR